MQTETYFPSKITDFSKASISKILIISRLSCMFNNNSDRHLKPKENHLLLFLFFLFKTSP